MRQPRPFGSGLTSQIIRTGQPLLINEDMDRNRAGWASSRWAADSASYLGVPIPSGGQMIGVISVQSTDQEGRFTEADQRLLSTIASAVGVAFHNARLFEDARLASAAAEEADAAKSSFLSTVSHELRTPLTSVLGFAKIIRRRLEERLFPLIPEDDRKVQQAKRQVIENLDVVVSEGERLTKLIDDVLDLAKIEAGKFTWNMASVSIADVIERAIAATASLVRSQEAEAGSRHRTGLARHHRRSGPADPGGHQPDLERGQIYRCRLHHLLRALREAIWWSASPTPASALRRPISRRSSRSSSRWATR